MTYNKAEMLGMFKSSTPEGQVLWNQIITDSEISYNNMVDRLRAAGIKACHPDDGWVRRECPTRPEIAGSVYLCYPQFNDGPDIGDTIALGWDDSDCLIFVKVITIVRSHLDMPGMNMPAYFFDLDDYNRQCAHRERLKEARISASNKRFDRFRRMEKVRKFFGLKTRDWRDYKHN